jgi:AsmA protein
MKALKWVGLALLAVLVVAVVAISVVAWRFDPAWAKQKLTQTLYEQKQRTLRIDGDLALSFFPSVGVTVGKASLSEHGSLQEFASIEHARASVRVLPLLARQVVVDHIQLDGARAHIVRGKDGRFNFDDLLSGEQEGKTSATPPQGKPIAFDVAGVAITRSAVVFQDDRAGRVIQLRDVSVKTGRLSQAASGPLEVAFTVDSPQPQLTAAFTLAGNYSYDLARKQYAVEKLDLKVKGKLGADALDASFDVPRIAWAGDRASGPGATGNLRLTGQDRQVDVKLDMSPIDGTASALKIGNVAAQWTLKRGPLASQGKTAGPMQVDLDARLLAAPKLTGELQIAHPQLPMKQLKLPLDASARVDWGKSQAAGNFSTRLEDSAVQCKWQVTSFSPLAAGVDLAIDKLDIDRYLPQAAPAQAAPAPAAKPGPAPAAPIDFSFLRGLDLKGAVRIGALQARNLKFSNVSGQLAVNKGRLDLNPLSANLYGGNLAGSMSAQADGNRVALKQTMNNVAIGPLIRDYAHKDILEGHGQIALDVSTAGNSVTAMRQSLNGSARVSLRDGAVKGIDLAKTLRQAKAMLAGGKQDAVVAANKAEKTDFTEMSASLRIANGVARNDDLSAKSPFLRVAGAGTIDLVHEQLDYVAKVTVVASAKGQEGKELADLNGLTIPVRLTGPYDNPSYHLQFSELAAGLAKQQVQKRLEQQVQKQLGDKKGLGDVLKGLIK